MTCQHAWKLCGHSGYAQCKPCGTFKSIEALPPDLIYTPDYWSHARNHSTLTEQVWNVNVHTENGKSKYEFVLDKIDTPERRSALEIGCAPGKLLLLLRGMAGFERVIGIETCPEWEPTLREIGGHGGGLRFGYFPACADGLADESFNLVLALDLLEHVEEPIPFLNACHRLLKPGGQLLLMLPLAEDSPDRFFLPTEHIWLFSKQHLFDLLQDTGFAVTDFDSWCPGHSSVSARKESA